MNADIDGGCAVVHPTTSPTATPTRRRPTSSAGRQTRSMADQLAVTLTRIPAHSNAEHCTGHHHEQIEGDPLVAGGTLTMRFGDALETVRARRARRAPRDPPAPQQRARTEKSRRFLLSHAS